MKTPREILLARHKDAEPKLDAIRNECVGQAVGNALSPSPPSGERAGVRGQSVLQLIWRELIFPSRRIWAGLAAIWLLIFAANFSMRDHPHATMAKTSPSPDMIMAYRQQEQLLTELIGPSDPPAAEPQKPYVPRPSSLRPCEILST